MKVKLLSSVWPSATPMDCSLPGSSVHGIFQARVLEWGAIASSEEPNGNLAIIVVLTYDFPWPYPGERSGDGKSEHQHFRNQWTKMDGNGWIKFQWPLYLLLWARTEKEMAPHSSTLDWKIPWMEEPGRLQSMGLLRVGHDWVTSLSLFTFMHWRRKWKPTSVFLPGESQGRGSLVGCCLWGRTESDTTEAT